MALAEMINVSPQSISQYENGQTTPSLEVFRNIAAALNMPEQFFLNPERQRTRGPTFYRSMSTATKTARTRASRRTDWLVDIAEYLTEFVELPPSNFPVLDLPDDPTEISADAIELAAEDVRSFWGMGEGPIANMVALLENQGAIVARDRLGTETLDGLSVLVDRPYILIGTDKGTPARWRFDAAHEMAHMLLHSHVSPELLSRPTHFKLIEDQAHLFAVAFLLPLASFGDDFFAANLDTLVALKPKWKVSVASMIMRARRAEFIDESTARRLWINLSRRGWRRREPFDDSMEVETPRICRRSFELMLENGQTAQDITGRLSLPVGDVESLAGLDRGQLSNFAPVALRDAPHYESSDHPSAQIIQMRKKSILNASD